MSVSKNSPVLLTKVTQMSTNLRMLSIGYSDFYLEESTLAMLFAKVLPFFENQFKSFFPKDNILARLHVSKSKNFGLNLVSNLKGSGRKFSLK